MDNFLFILYILQLYFTNADESSEENQKDKPHIEIRTIMVNCPFYKDPTIQYSPSNFNSINITQNRIRDILPFSGFDKDEILFDINDVTECKRKIIFTIKLNGKEKGHYNTELITVDHVYDTTTRKRFRLLNPYVIKLQNVELLQMYYLKLQNIINAEPTEEVYNNLSQNYTGCNDGTENPTCGLVSYKSQIVPYSQGFCCSCNLRQNEKQQPKTLPPKYQPRNPEFVSIKHKRNTPCIKTYVTPNFPEYCPWHKKLFGPQKYFFWDFFYNNYSLNNPYKSKNFRWEHASRRQKQLQPRGGQNCAERNTPPQLDPEKYHASTHCLRFNDLWYKVYELAEPIVEHSLHIQIYEKVGPAKWLDLTNGERIKIGSINTNYSNKPPITVSIKYSALTQCHREPFNLNPSTMRLLIPELLTPNYPEYLVVPPEQITLEGDECDKLGVSYKAFVTQPDRCKKPPGTCLNNQPSHLWHRDKKAELNRKKGCYFLKYFGKIAKTQEANYLSLIFDGFHSSVLDVEVNADDNRIIRTGIDARIMEVYVDNTAQHRTEIIVKIMNTGFSSSTFMPRITECPRRLPLQWRQIAGNFQTIAPFHQHTFKLDVIGEQNLDKFHCTVEVINGKNELVSIRRILFQRWDRCLCIFHCLCTCIDSAKGLQCDPMSDEHYHAAGFHGQVPRTINDMDEGSLNIFSYVFWLTWFGWFTGALIGLGLLKGILGLRVQAIGIWGIDKITPHPHVLCEYREENLRHRCVVHDDTGWPIHPDTYCRTVRVLSRLIFVCRPVEFVMNIFFFIIYPLTRLFKLLWSLTRCCCRKKKKEPSECCEWVNTPYKCNSNEKSKLLYETISKKCSNPSTKCSCSRCSSRRKKSKKKNKRQCAGADAQTQPTQVVSNDSQTTYEDTNGEQEQEDTNYVLNELHKSKISLNETRHQHSDH